MDRLYKLFKDLFTVVFFSSIFIVNNAWSVSIAIPVDVRLAIEREAEYEWPDDFKMKNHRIDSQKAAYEEIRLMKSYLDIPASTFSKIKSQAKGKWPNNYTQQLSRIKSQGGAYQMLLGLSKYQNVSYSVYREIELQAKKSWPNNYVMQVHSIKEKVAKYNQKQNNGSIASGSVDNSTPQPQGNRTGIYKCVTEGGKTIFSGLPCKGASMKIVVQPSEHIYDRCRELELYAVKIMKIRQKGVPVSKLMKTQKEKQISSLKEAVIFDAYRYTRYDDKSNQDYVITKFRDEVYLACSK